MHLNVHVCLLGNVMTACRLRTMDGWSGVRGEFVGTKPVLGRLWDEPFRHLGHPPKFYRVQDAGFINGSSSWWQINVILKICFGEITNTCGLICRQANLGWTDFGTNLILVPPWFWYHPEFTTTLILLPPWFWYHPDFGTTLILVPPWFWYQPDFGTNLILVYIRFNHILFQEPTRLRIFESADTV